MRSCVQPMAVMNRLWCLLVVVLLFVGGTVVGASGDTATSAPEQTASMSPREFLALAERGLEGTYRLTYRVDGKGGDGGLTGSGSLIVAQRARAGTTAWPDLAGTWSFSLTESPNSAFQWIEEGGTAEDCWHWPRHLAMICTGPAPYEASNGFILATLPFVPGTAVVGVRSSIDSEIGPRPRLTVFSENGSAVTGPLTCLRVDEADGATTCITRSGIVASVSPDLHIGLLWSSVQLVREQPAPLPSDFVPWGKLTSPFGIAPT
jgi:hypothetical protein